MAFELRFTNYRVEIEPSHGYVSGNRDESDKRTCEEIINAVKRHVDDVNYVHVVRDTYRHCTHCGYDPAEDEWNDYGTSIPCCDEAVKEHASGDLKGASNE